MTVSLLTLSDGRALEVLTGGDPDGFPWLFHMGSPSAVVPFAPLDEAARAAGLRLITYSRPGYGGSAPRPVTGTPAMVDDMAEVGELLDLLGVDEFVTLGWSGGGPRALASAARLAPRCRAALGLAGPAPYDAIDWTEGMAPENVAEYTAASQGRDAYDAFLTVEFAPLFAITAPEVVAGMGELLTEVDREALDSEYSEWLAAMMRRSGQQGVLGAREDGLAAVNPWGFDVAEITVPVTLWYGTDDAMVPPRHGDWLAAHVPGAVVHRCDGEGHVSLLRRLPELLAELRDLAAL